MNTYPLLVSQDMVFRSKETTMQSSVSVMVYSLSGLDRLNEENYFFRKGKLRIKASSPCRDAGADEDWMLYATDLNGKPRIFSRHVDIGAVESQSGGLIMHVK